MSSSMSRPSAMASSSGARGRAVEGAVHLRPLGELVGVAPALELVGVDEVVLAAVDLGAARRRASCTRPRA